MIVVINDTYGEKTHVCKFKSGNKSANVFRALADLAESTEFADDEITSIEEALDVQITVVDEVDIKDMD